MKKKFDYKDFYIETEIDSGYDDIIYGHSVDWDDFRLHNEEELLDYFGIHIPWGEKISITEMYNFISLECFTDASIFLDYQLNSLPISIQGNELSEVVIEFPKRDGFYSERIVSDIFDYHEVPSGFAQEYELPEGLQFWSEDLYSDPEEDEYEYYKNSPIHFNDFDVTLSEIREKVNSTSDNLTKKSLILSSMIISESLLKSVIIERIPEESNITPFSQKLLKNEINRKIRGNFEIRNKLFKDLFDQKAPSQNWINLRNSLAHNIEPVKIEGEKIIYLDSINEKNYEYLINDLFNQQLEFGSQLKSIVCR